MNVGYARVSTDDQCLDLQVAALGAAGCDRIYEDHGVSGALMDRPGLAHALDALSAGDQFVVWRLDRLGRSLSGVVQTVDLLARKNVEFRSITEGLDTTSNCGRLIFHIMAALAEFERDLISERTRAGMRAAIGRGKRVGRPPALSERQLQEVSHELGRPVPDLSGLADRFGVSRRTLARHVKRLEG
ncbi:Site-specific DNA recombinase [Lutimaribacter pacificus]|uniref:Site-specific DNA recombinase n=1 Tax=Lutimaribacter pacificus TaxID=391948 RepID=A0A1H0IUH8_9RHOB|nr:recombinase family protein [Lutimaribacter pacificus]SDO35146.1 Site-specific DNA recombinase [Lutimaribacter pacificus]SHK17356.1 Site-specific DNA recombinase [Lutimaribacter pacificus]